MVYLWVLGFPVFKNIYVQPRARDGPEKISRNPEFRVAPSNRIYSKMLSEFRIGKFNLGSQKNVRIPTRKSDEFPGSYSEIRQSSGFYPRNHKLYYGNFRVGTRNSGGNTRWEYMVKGV